MDSSFNERTSSTTESHDVVDLRKALATGNAKETTAAPAAVSSIVCYCIASIVMTMVNKFVVSGQNFSMNFLLLCIQSTVCCVCVAAVKKFKVITFRDFDVQDAKAWFPISFLLVSVIYTGSKSLQYLSIPVYTIFKNLTIILIAYGEVLWFGGRVTGLTLVSFFFMVLSSIVAAVSDMAHVADGDVTEITLSQVSNIIPNLNIGYLWMMTNCATSAAYVLAMRKRIKVTGFSDWDTMFYNNLLSIPVLVIFSIVLEDWGSENLSRNFPPDTRNLLLSAIMFSGAAAVGISYTTAWCVRVTSSTTYSMVGALNKLPIATSGMLFFGDAVTFGSVSAVAIGFFAGVVYAVAKNNQKKQESAHAQNDVILPLSNRKH